MKKFRSELEYILNDAIKTVRTNRKITMRINQNMQENNVDYGVFEQISRGELNIETIEIPLLWALTDAIYKETNSHALVPGEWFTDAEIRTAAITLREDNKPERVSLPIEFDNTIEVDYDTYVTAVDIAVLTKMYNSQLIRYEFESQRSAKYLNGVPVPDVNVKSVNDISKHMLEGTYFPDMITLNAFNDNIDVVDYDEKSKVLRILESADITITDGFHRLQAAVKTQKMNPDVKQQIIVSIRNYDPDKQQRYFGQINTINAVKKERLNELKMDKISDITVKELQQMPALKGKIASATRITHSAGHLTTFDLMTYFVGKIFNPSNKIEARKTAKELDEFYEYVFNFYSEKLSNQEDVLSHPLVFAGLVVVARFMVEQHIDPLDLQTIVDKVDFYNSDVQPIISHRRGFNNTKVRDMMVKFIQNKLEMINRNEQ